MEKNTLIFTVFTLINYCLHIFNEILKKLYYLCTYKKRRQQHPLILLTTSCVKPLFWGVVTARKANKKLYT